MSSVPLVWTNLRFILVNNINTIKFVLFQVKTRLPFGWLDPLYLRLSFTGCLGRFTL